uniref:Putative secreted protein n=1 Tax=Anopheles darlingi TaxID=43151 RepID=A0A2M4D2U0_ANODA
MNGFLCLLTVSLRDLAQSLLLPGPLFACSSRTLPSACRHFSSSSFFSACSDRTRDRSSVFARMCLSCCLINSRCSSLHSASSRELSHLYGSTPSSQAAFSW